MTTPPTPTEEEMEAVKATTPDTARREAIKRIVAKAFLIGECSDAMCDARILHLGIADGRKLETVTDAILAKESQALGEAMALLREIIAADDDWHVLTTDQRSRAAALTTGARP